MHISLFCRKTVFRFSSHIIQDILNELPPTSPPEASTSAAGGLSPSQAGPDRSHGANSTLHKLLLTRNDPVAGRSRPSPVRSPENKKTLEKLKSSLSASNPLLSQQLSRWVDTLSVITLFPVSLTNITVRGHILLLV